jgi:hypothetical protein
MEPSHFFMSILLHSIKNEIKLKNIAILNNHLDNMKAKSGSMAGFFRKLLERRSLLSLLEENGSVAKEMHLDVIAQACADMISTSLKITTKKKVIFKVPMYLCSDVVISIHVPMRDRTSEVMTELFGVSFSFFYILASSEYISKFKFIVSSEYISCSELRLCVSFNFFQNQTDLYGYIKEPDGDEKLESQLRLSTSDVS